MKNNTYRNLSIFIVLAMMLSISSPKFIYAECGTGCKTVLGIAGVAAGLWLLFGDDTDSSEGNSSQKSEAEVLVEEASRHMDKKEFSQAFDKYCRAYQLTYDSDIERFAKQGMEQAKDARERRGLSANWSCP